MNLILFLSGYLNIIPKIFFISRSSSSTSRFHLAYGSRSLHPGFAGRKVKGSSLRVLTFLVWSKGTLRKEKKREMRPADSKGRETKPKVVGDVVAPGVVERRRFSARERSGVWTK